MLPTSSSGCHIRVVGSSWGKCSWKLPENVSVSTSDGVSCDSLDDSKMTRLLSKAGMGTYMAIMHIDVTSCLLFITFWNKNGKSC